jgi:hypothetical protein
MPPLPTRRALTIFTYHVKMVSVGCPAPANRRRLASWLVWVSAAVALLSCCPTAHAHPVHTSYAEADYRPASGKLEIAWRLFTDDAEAALSRRAGRPVAVARTPAAELDVLLLAYVRATFAVKTPAGVPATFTWVGRELADAGQHLWIYFECALSGGPERARFANRGLREVFSDQINSVRVRDHSTTPARQATLLFLNDTEQTVNLGP